MTGPIYLRAGEASVLMLARIFGVRIELSEKNDPQTR